MSEFCPKHRAFFRCSNTDLRKTTPWVESAQIDPAHRKCQNPVSSHPDGAQRCRRQHGYNGITAVGKESSNHIAFFDALFRQPSGNSRDLPL